jgi:hypothetical protein
LEEVDMPFSTYLANALLDHVRPAADGGATFTKPEELWVALHSSDPTPAGTIATEVVGGSYSRLQVILTSPVNGISSNTEELQFGTLPTVSPGITHISLWDSETDGEMLYYDDIPSVIINSGDRIRIPAGNFIVNHRRTDV